MRKMALVALSAAGIIAGCQRAPVFPEILMTYHDVEWLKANEDQIPVIVSECDKIMRSEEHTSELQSLMRISYAVFCLQKKTCNIQTQKHTPTKTKHKKQT